LKILDICVIIKAVKNNNHKGGEMDYSRMTLNDLSNLKDSIAKSLDELPDIISKCKRERDEAENKAEEAAVSEAAAAVIDSKSLDTFNYGKDKKEFEAAKRRYEDLLHKAISRQSNYKIVLREVDEALTAKHRTLKQLSRVIVEKRVGAEMAEAQEQAGAALARLIALAAHRDLLRPEALDRLQVITRYLEVDRKLSVDTVAVFEALEAGAVAAARAKL
jgi:hypothetical protein